MLLLMKALSLFAAAILALSPGLKADDAIPDIVTKGTEALAKEGAAAAIDVWLQGSPINSDSAGKSKLLGGMSAVQDLYGKPLGFELIESFAMTPSLTRVYGIITYEKGPLYARWDCYKSAGGWIVPEFLVNTTAEQVLPQSLLTD